jgi:DNA-binding transcriptional MerR regulator
VATYSIKDLERISGIKAHTLRIWEQRYRIIKPLRSDTNIRSYSDEELKILLNIGILNNNGFKISNIAAMPRVEIESSVLEITKNSDDATVQIENLLIAMVEMDEERFEKFISANIIRIGFEKTFKTLIVPFLSRVGVLWLTNSINPAQEHFISNLIRQKVIAAIDGIHQVYDPLAPKCLLFLPENELHEINLLIANYFLKNNGFKTIYLGQNVPYSDLEMVYNLHQPKYIVSVFTCTNSANSIQKYVQKIAEDFSKTMLLFSGYETNNLELPLPTNVKLYHGPDELVAYIK